MKKKIVNFEEKREQVLQALDPAHAAYYKAELFGGPSLYFHHQALRAAESYQFEHFADSAYAVLAAWGMHRMGPGGSKMREFAEFEASLKPLWPVLRELRQARPDTLDAAGWRDLRGLFCGIRCMASATSLVGNSKVLAHAIPNLIPPVDREYTLKFLYERKDIDNGIEGECERLEQILREFFYPLVLAEAFKNKAEEWMRPADKFPWDTSPLKVADNLIIGIEKLRRRDSD